MRFGGKSSKKAYWREKPIMSKGLLSWEDLLAYLELFAGSETVVESATTFVADVELLPALPLPAEPLLPLLPAFWAATDDAPAVDDDAIWN